MMDMFLAIDKYICSHGEVRAALYSMMNSRKYIEIYTLRNRTGGRTDSHQYK